MGVSQWNVFVKSLWRNKEGVGGFSSCESIKGSVSKLDSKVKCMSKMC